jgi:hypothetical protein
VANRSRQLPSHRRLPGLLLLLPAFFFLTTGFASSRFTEKQLEAFGKYVGKTYWVMAEEGKRPLFFSAPSPAATSFLPEPKESFQVTEIVEGAMQRPAYYYKVSFASGREGYIDLDSFLGQLNLTLLTVDPDRGQKVRSAKEAEEENKRAARIRAQPWPEHIKEAVLQRKAVLGMAMKEAREALGKPTRVVKVRDASPLMGQQEQWIYQSGPVLTFTNGLITRIQTAGGKAE